MMAFGSNGLTCLITGVQRNQFASTAMRAGGLVVFGVTVVCWGASIIVDIVCVLHQTMSVWQFFLSSMCTPHAIGGALEHHHTRDNGGVAAHSNSLNAGIKST